MAALKKAALAASALLWAGSARAEPADPWASAIAHASVRFGVPQSWIRSVIRVESGGHRLLHGQPIVSRAGAIGLMQLMPGTWRDMRLGLGLGGDPHAAADNIMAGTAYLRLMYDRFGYPGLFAAYNAGPKRYGAYLAGAARLPAETRAYVAAVAQPNAPPPVIRPLPAVTLFAVRTSPTLIAPAEPFPSRPATLFVALSGRSSR